MYKIIRFLNTIVLFSLIVRYLSIETGTPPQLVYIGFVLIINLIGLIVIPKTN